jgi:hypothetical protein
MVAGWGQSRAASWVFPLAGGLAASPALLAWAWHPEGLANIVHHGMARLIDWHGNGSTLAAGAASQWHTAKLRRRGCMLPCSALNWALLLELLLLGMAIEWRSEAGCQG